jgi:hypothetical protein
MSMPERKTPRPVKSERAAPTPKCAAIESVNDRMIAVRPLVTRKGKTGINAPTAVANPVTHPSRSAQFELRLFAQHVLWVPQRVVRQCVRNARLHSFCFIQQGEFITLQLRHERNLLALHRDLVLVHFEFALGCEIAARSHR